MLDAIELRQGKLVLPDYHKDTDTFSVEAELCADYDASAAVVTSSVPKTAAKRKRAAPTSRSFCFYVQRWQDHQLCSSPRPHPLERR